MAQYYKKGSLGMMVKAEGGASDPELTEVRLTADEYADMWKRIHAAERATKEAEAAGERKLNELRRSANKQIAQYETEANERAASREKAADLARQAAEQKAAVAQATAEEMREEVKRANYLNGNLKRIARERANAARGITPKKEHDGYLVLSSRQWTEHYQVDEWDTDAHKQDYDTPEKRATAIKCKYLKVVSKTADVWKSVLQTPYDASLALNQIRGLVEDDDLWDGGVLQDIGCPAMCQNKNNGIYQDFGKNDDGYEINGLYKWKFVANYKSGFWEVEIFTTKSLQVPQHRRPPKRTNKK